jgi:hypothetical protein
VLSLFYRPRHRRATAACHARSWPCCMSLPHPWPHSMPLARPRPRSMPLSSSSSSPRHCRATFVDIDPGSLGASHCHPLPQALDTIMLPPSPLTPPPSVSSPKLIFFIISNVLVMLIARPCYAGYPNDLNVLINRYLSSCFCYMI